MAGFSGSRPGQGGKILPEAANLRHLRKSFRA
jgi:hypothetical protein